MMIFGSARLCKPDFGDTACAVQPSLGLRPKDIRAWINAKGGYKKMPIEGVWTLSAPDLWKMGHRRCSD